MSKSNLFNVILVIIVLALLYFTFFTKDEDYVTGYNAQIEALEAKVDSLHTKNDLLEDQADSLESHLIKSDKKIKQLNSRIYVIKKNTQKQLDAVDNFGDDELEQFFASRYQQSDSIN